MAGRAKPPSRTTSAASSPLPGPAGQKVDVAELNTLLTAALRPLMEKMDSLQQEVRESNKKSEQTSKELSEVKVTTEENVSRLKKLQKVVSSQNEKLLRLQVERASFSLRFQGISEKQGENLKKILSEALAPITGMQAEALQSDMDMVYRTYPEFLKKKNMPGEVMVRFSKRSTRDVVLRATNKQTLKIQEEEIKILKDIPYEIRKKRKAYKELIIWLQSENIVYRWLTPEGLTFQHRGKKEKIDSVAKATFFLDCFKKKKNDKDATVDSLALQESLYGLENSAQESSEEGSSEVSDSEKGAAGPKIPQEEKKKKKKGRPK